MTWQGAVDEARRHPACHTPGANLDGLAASGAPPPRVPRGGGLDVCSDANSMDAAKSVAQA